jgi:hypothetical protein
MAWYRLNFTLRSIVLFWLREFNKAKTLFVRFFVLLYSKNYKDDPHYRVAVEWQLYVRETLHPPGRPAITTMLRDTINGTLCTVLYRVIINNIRDCAILLLTK